MNPMPVVTWRPAPVAGPRSADPGMALYELYGAHYQSLVRVAEILVRDVATAEEIVQDAFVAMYGAWARLRDPGKARAYLQQSVVNRSRSVLRRRAVEDRNGPPPPPAQR